MDNTNERASYSLIDGVWWLLYEGTPIRKLTAVEQVGIVEGPVYQQPKKTWVRANDA